MDKGPVLVAMESRSVASCVSSNHCLVLNSWSFTRQISNKCFPFHNNLLDRVNEPYLESQYRLRWQKKKLRQIDLLFKGSNTNPSTYLKSFPKVLFTPPNLSISVTNIQKTTLKVLDLNQDWQHHQKHRINTSILRSSTRKKAWGLKHDKPSCALRVRLFVSPLREPSQKLWAFHSGIDATMKGTKTEATKHQDT